MQVVLVTGGDKNKRLKCVKGVPDRKQWSSVAVVDVVIDGFVELQSWE